MWDDHLFSDKVMHRAARLIPPLIWYVLLRVAFYDTPVLLNVLHKACLIYLIVAVLQLVAAFLDTLYEISSRHETLRNRPLKGVYQMIKLLAVCVGAILIVSILIGQDATAVLAGLGASAAIIMLISGTASWGWSPACSSRPTTCCVPGTGSRWPNTAPTAM